jgi:hypothetical protein
MRLDRQRNTRATSRRRNAIMSNFEHKPNRGSLFKNTDKQGDQDRDYAGSALIGDREWWVSAWISEGKSGRKYLSLSFKPRDADTAKPKNETAKSVGGGRPHDFDDQIPFGPEVR